MTTLYRTRENDPQVAAKRLVQAGERILSSRGDHRSAEAVGPHCRIQAADGAVRMVVVSQRDSTRGCDD